MAGAVIAFVFCVLATTFLSGFLVALWKDGRRRETIRVTGVGVDPTLCEFEIAWAPLTSEEVRQGNVPRRKVLQMKPSLGTLVGDGMESDLESIAQ